MKTAHLIAMVSFITSCSVMTTDSSKNSVDGVLVGLPTSFKTVNGSEKVYLIHQGDAESGETSIEEIFNKNGIESRVLNRCVGLSAEVAYKYTVGVDESGKELPLTIQQTSVEVVSIDKSKIFLLNDTCFSLSKLRARYYTFERNFLISENAVDLGKLIALDLQDSNSESLEKFDIVKKHATSNGDHINQLLGSVEIPSFVLVKPLEFSAKVNITTFCGLVSDFNIPELLEKARKSNTACDLKTTSNSFGIGDFEIVISPLLISEL